MPIRLTTYTIMALNKSRFAVAIRHDGPRYPKPNCYPGLAIKPCSGGRLRKLNVGTDYGGYPRW